MQYITKRKINPINFELANKGGQVPCSIHGAQLRVHFTTFAGICSFMDKLLGVSRQWRNVEPQIVFAPVLCFTVLKFFEDKFARRWQTKEGTYRVKKQFLSDVRDGGDVSMGDA